MGRDNRWTFNPPLELRELIDAFESRLHDWSPVMQTIASDMEMFVEDVIVPTRGQGKWRPLAQSTLERDRYRRRYRNVTYPANSRKGLLRMSDRLRLGTGRDWSPRNAAVLNAMPHAHLMQHGTDRYETPVWQSGGRRRSRQESSRLLRTQNGDRHAPPRFFVYVDNERADALYGPWILEYFFGEVER